MLNYAKKEEEKEIIRTNYEFNLVSSMIFYI